MSLTIEKQIELLVAGHPLEINDSHEAIHAGQNDIGKNAFYIFILI